MIVVYWVQGVAGAEDIDTGMKLGTNQPMGPLQLADFIGIMKYIQSLTVAVLSPSCVLRCQELLCLTTVTCPCHDAKTTTQDLSFIASRLSRVACVQDWTHVWPS